MQIKSEYKEKSNTNIAELEQIFGKISEDELNKSYSAGSWSIGECIDHIIITNTVYLSHIKTKLAENIFPKKKFRMRLFAGKMIKWMEPPVKIKVKTFEVFQPEKVSDYTKAERIAEANAILDDIPGMSAIGDDGLREYNGEKLIFDFKLLKGYTKPP